MFESLFGVMLGLCVICALSLCRVVIALCNWDKDNIFNFICNAIYLVTSIICLSVLDGVMNTPSAMEYHQGKTTVEYTIRDGVKLDSVIVFKDNMKK
jgi:hypothetical protein